MYDGFAPVTQMGGFHLMLPQLAVAARFATVRDYEAWLKRLDAVAVDTTHLIERMQAAIDARWMPSKAAIARVPQQLDEQLDADPQKSPEYQRFKSLPRDIPPDLASPRRAASAPMARSAGATFSGVACGRFGGGIR